MTTMPASQAFLIVGLSASAEPASTRIASGLARMMLLSELICAWTVFSTFSILRSTRPASGPLFDRDLGDALHLLAPVVADEIVGQVDRVFLVGGGRALRRCRPASRAAPRRPRDS